MPSSLVHMDVETRGAAAAALLPAELPIAQPAARRVLLTIGIITVDEPAYARRRQNIRESWKKLCVAPTCSSWFVFGRDAAESAQEEAERFADVVVLVSSNNTVFDKFFDWVAHALRTPEQASEHYIAKVDDDAIVYPQGVLLDLQQSAAPIDLYGALQFTSYDIGAQKIRGYGLTLHDAFGRQRGGMDKNGFAWLGPFPFIKGPLVVLSRRAASLLYDECCATLRADFVRRAAAMSRHARLPEQRVRLLDDVITGACLHTCERMRPLTLADVRDKVGLIEFRRWQRYEKAIALPHLRAVHVGHDTKKQHWDCFVDTWRNSSGTVARTAEPAFVHPPARCAEVWGAGIEHREDEPYLQLLQWSCLVNPTESPATGLKPNQQQPRGYTYHDAVCGTENEAGPSASTGTSVVERR